MIITATLSLAQKDLRPGYIIKSDHDTIYGLIDYRGDILNCSKCVFYDNRHSEPKTFYPGDIFAYRFIDSRFYVTRSIKTGSDDKLVFLEYLVNGITKLYYLRDNIGDHYFIEKGEELYELTNKTSVVINEYESYYKESNLYKGLMTFVYADAKDLKSSIDDARFDRKSMVKLSEKYHDLVCKDRKCIIYEKKVREFVVKAGPVIRWEWSQAKYHDILDHYQFNSAKSFQAGIAADLQLLSINEKLHMGLSAMIGEEKSFGTYNRSLLATTENNYLNTKKNEILTSFDLKYTYPKGNLRPIAGIGYEISFITSQKTKLTTDIFDLSGVLVSKTEDNDYVHYRNDSGVFGTLGLSHNIKKKIVYAELFYKECWGKYIYFTEWLSGGIKGAQTGKSHFSSLGVQAGLLF